MRFDRVSVQKENRREAIGEKTIPDATAHSSLLGTLALWGETKCKTSERMKANWNSLGF